jgi:hypothetical protein
LKHQRRVPSIIIIIIIMRLSSSYLSFPLLALVLPPAATAFQAATTTVIQTRTATTTCSPNINNNNNNNSRITQCYLKKATDDQAVAPSLSSEQDQDLRRAAESLTGEFGYGWFNKDEAWEAFAKEYPQMAEEFSQDELRIAYIKQSPQLLDILTKTPLGPVLLINLIVLASGFSWCDTPFHQDGAQCPLPPMM